MSAKCPFCGSSKTEKTFNFNESTCTVCNCDFKVIGDHIRVFNEGSWEIYCQNMAKHVSNTFKKAEIVELGTRLFKEHARSPEEIDILYDQVVSMAENLNYETKAGVRDRFDFIEMVKIAESVEATYKTLYERREDLELEIKENQDLFGDPEFQDEIDLPGELEDPEDFEEPEDEYFSDFESDMNPSFPGDDPESDYSKMTSQNRPVDDDVPGAMLGLGKNPKGFYVNGEELEEDHLDDNIKDIESGLRDASDETYTVRTPDDVRDVREKIKDVERAVDSLWDDYKDGYEDEEGGDDLGMGLGLGDDDLGDDIGLGDEEGDDDLDLGLGDEEGDDDLGLGDEEGDDLDLGLGDEEEEDKEGLVGGLDVASHQRKGNKLNEATVGSSKSPTDLATSLKKGNKNFNKAVENPGYYKSHPGIGVQKSLPDFEDSLEDGQVKDDIPFVQGEEVEDENQFGDDKLSTARGAVKGTPSIDDFTLEGRPTGTGLGIREGFNGYRVNDMVFISESKDEWQIVAINKNMATVQRKNTKTEVDLLSENVDHCDRNLRSHRDTDLMNESKRRWELIQKQINEAGCIGGVCGLGDGSSGQLGSTMVSDMSVASLGNINNVPQTSGAVADKSEIYKYIKDNGLNQKPREIAIDDLTHTFNNFIEEINQILDDAVLSNDQLQTESIDSLYNYATNEMRRFEEDRKISDAYTLIEARLSKQRNKLLKESKSNKKQPIITRRKEQNNDPAIENLGRNWMNKISEGLYDGYEGDGEYDTFDSDEFAGGALPDEEYVDDDLVSATDAIVSDLLYGRNPDDTSDDAMKAALIDNGYERFITGPSFEKIKSMFGQKWDKELGV